jgi:hypothetical protein
VRAGGDPLEIAATVRLPDRDRAAVRGVALLAVSQQRATTALLGTVGAWFLLIVVLQLRNAGQDPDERLSALTATAAATVLTVLAGGLLAAAGISRAAVVVAAVAVAAAALARAAVTVPGEATVPAIPTMDCSSCAICSSTRTSSTRSRTCRGPGRSRP